MYFDFLACLWIYNAMCSVLCYWSEASYCDKWIVYFPWTYNLDGSMLLMFCLLGILLALQCVMFCFLSFNWDPYNAYLDKGIERNESLIWCTVCASYWCNNLFSPPVIHAFVLRSVYGNMLCLLYFWHIFSITVQYLLLSVMYLSREQCARG